MDKTGAIIKASKVLKKWKGKVIKLEDKILLLKTNKIQKSQWALVCIIWSIMVNCAILVLGPM